MDARFPPPRFICILAMPRTGSSYLGGLLEGDGHFNYKAELFHQNTVRRLSEADLQAHRAASHGQITDDASLCAWRSAHPGRTLDLLFESGGRRPLLFKLFPRHIKHELLLSELFARDDVAYILLRRRPIESFISLQKANALQVWGRVDTTMRKPELMPERFVAWAKESIAWDRLIARHLVPRTRRIAEVSYERHLNVADPAAARRAALDAIEALGLQQPIKWWRQCDLIRQDREDRYQARVANWHEFEAQLRADPAKAALLDWAMAEPPANARKEGLLF
jgi:LPS sulfotransferase NodH